VNFGVDPDDEEDNGTLAGDLKNINKEGHDLDDHQTVAGDHHQPVKRQGADHDYET